jgi:hypothetical protein
MIMINEVQNDDVRRGTGTPAGYMKGSYYTSLQRQLGAWSGTGVGMPDQSLDANGVSISVVGIHGDTATVKISTAFLPPCLHGFVWRGASKNDGVCVIPSQQKLVAQENRDPHRSDGRCAPSYVPRHAFDGDDVCVTPAQQARIKMQNQTAYLRVAWVEYGPLTCHLGYVWRQADQLDYVCVPPETRAQTLADNQANTHSRHKSGSNDCIPGFVFREAFPGDTACVSPSVRSQVQLDNAQAANHFKNPQS